MGVGICHSESLRYSPKVTLHLSLPRASALLCVLCVKGDVNQVRENHRVRGVAWKKEEVRGERKTVVHGWGMHDNWSSRGSYADLLRLRKRQ